MKPLRAISAILPLALAAALPAQFTPGNIVVVRVGDGTAALTNASTAAFLDEYTPVGSLVSTVALPTLASGANLPCTNSGSATSEGILTLSTDGRYFVCAGYGTAPGLTGVASSTTPAVPRVVARVSMAGAIDSSTGITDSFSGNNIRSATTTDGSAFWSAGAAGGVHYGALGSATTVQVASNLSNCRVVNLVNGQLYTSSASTTFLGVATVGTGLPTTTGSTIALLPGFPTTGGTAAESAYDYFFADANTLYVADDNAGRGIQKWTFAASTWTLQYTLNPGTGLGCRGLHGYVSGGVATLFATTSASTLVAVVDTGASATFTAIATAPANTAFRGVRRVPGTYLTFGAGCTGSLGVPGNVGLDAPTIGATVSANLTNLPVNAAFFVFGWSNTSSVFGPLPLDLTGFGAPGCPGRVSTDSVSLITGTGNVATFHLTIPNNPIYLGTVFYTQGLALDPTANPLGAVTSDAAKAIVGN